MSSGQGFKLSHLFHLIFKSSWSPWNCVTPRMATFPKKMCREFHFKAFSRFILIRISIELSIDWCQLTHGHYHVQKKWRKKRRLILLWIDRMTKNLSIEWNIREYTEINIGKYVKNPIPLIIRVFRWATIIYLFFENFHFFPKILCEFLQNTIRIRTKNKIL